MNRRDCIARLANAPVLPLLPLLSLLLVAACSAEFKSGVTACGLKEPRCPAGFTCVNNVRCVKMGDNIDVGRTDGGSPPSGQDAAVVPPVTNPDAPVQMDAVAPAQDAGLVAMDVASNPDLNVVPAGQAVVKFCNPIRRVDGNPIEMELVVGSLRLKASTRECTPALEMACQGLPAGPVKMQLLRDGMMLATRDVTLDQSGQYLVYARFDGMNSIDVMKLAVGQNCPEFSFPPVSYLKFCNQIVARDAMGAVMDVSLDLVWGMEKVTAVSRTCNTMDNLACYYTRSGQVRLALQDAGKEIAFLMANLAPNANYGVLAQVDATTRQPKLVLVPLQPGQTCASYKPPSAPPPVYDGGVGDARSGG